MHEAALLVPLLLALAVPLHCAGMRLAVAFPVVGMLLAPLMAAVQADLPVEGIGGDLLAVVIPPAALLAVGLVASKLVGVIRGRLEELLAVAAGTIAHQAAPEVGGNRSLSAESTRHPKGPKCDIETAIEFFYRVPADGEKTNRHLETARGFLTAPMAWLPIPAMPVILSTFYPGADKKLRTAMFAATARGQRTPPTRHLL